MLKDLFRLIGCLFKDRMPLCGQAKRDGMTVPSVPNHMFLHLIMKEELCTSSNGYLLRQPC